MTFDPKAQVIELLKRHHEVSKLRGQSIFSVNSRAIAYIRFSKRHKNEYYFGVGEKEFSAIKDKNSFILFICGDVENIVVLPSAVFDELFRDISPTSGQWKLNIFEEGSLLLLQATGKGKFDVTDFKNNFDFTPLECRKIPAPQVKPHSSLKRERMNKSPKEEKVTTLEEKLRKSVLNSDSPSEFEEVLAAFFRTLGLKGRRIGGSGDTDILIEEPKRIIVDAKSTRAPSLSQVNFARLKRHKKSNTAETMLIVSGGFAPALIRDAENEEAGLISVDSLVKLLSIHREMPCSPGNYTDLFPKVGLITETDLEKLVEDRDNCSRWIKAALFLSNALDLEFRSLDEIKGRVDVQAQQLKVASPSKERIKSTLDSMAGEPFRLVSIRDGLYALRFYPQQLRERIQAILRMIFSEP